MYIHIKNHDIREYFLHYFFSREKKKKRFDQNLNSIELNGNRNFSKEIERNDETEIFLQLNSKRNNYQSWIVENELYEY